MVRVRNMVTIRVRVRFLFWAFGILVSIRKDYIIKTAPL